MQDLNDMLLFVEVIEHGGFAAASRASGMPKSRLSRRAERVNDFASLCFLNLRSNRGCFGPQFSPSPMG